MAYEWEHEEWKCALKDLTEWDYAACAPAEDKWSIDRDEAEWEAHGPLEGYDDE